MNGVGTLADPAVLIPLVFVLGLMPLAVVMLTAYTKIVVVFSLLRNALGLQQVPPTMVTNGLALVLTWYVMYPVGLQMLDAIGVDRNAPSVPSLSTLQVLDRAKERAAEVRPPWLEWASSITIAKLRPRCSLPISSRMNGNF